MSSREKERWEREMSEKRMCDERKEDRRGETLDVTKKTTAR